VGKRQAQRTGRRVPPAGPPIIVGGCPRSGTTLLRLILDSHPAIACGPEFKMLGAVATAYLRMRRLFGPVLRESYGVDERMMAERFGDLITGLLEPYRVERGKRRVAEKTPQNVHAFAALSIMLPRSPLVHLIRDGRDVIVSLLEQRWIDPATGEPLGYTQDIRQAAQHWVKSIGDGRAVPAERRAGYHEVRYEKLVTEPERELRSLFAFLGERWDPVVLRFHEIEHDFAASEIPSHGSARFAPIHASSIGRWRERWSEEDRAIVKEVAGDMLIALEYETGTDW